MEESMVRNEILDAISFINESVEDSVFAVYDSIIVEYEKISTMMDNASENWMVFQEGEVWDTAIGKDKVESGIMKIIAFIPRLFKGIINAIGSVFSKEKAEDIKKNTANTKNLIENATTEQLAESNAVVKEVTKDELGFDPEKKEFFVKRGLKHIRNYFLICTSFSDLFRKLMIKIKGGNTNYGSMAEEIKAVLINKKEIGSDTFYASVDELYNLWNTGYKISSGLRGVCSEISMMLEKKMREDFKNGGDVAKKANAKKMLDEIEKASKHAMRATFFGSIFSKALETMGGPLYRKFILKNEITDDDVELENTKAENKAKKRELRGLKNKEKNLRTKGDLDAEKRAKIQAEKAKGEALDKKISKAEKSVAATQDYLDDNDIRWDTEGKLPYEK